MKHRSVLVLSPLLLAGLVSASDWNNAGGNASRSAVADVSGPIAAVTAWSSTLGATRGAQPVTEGSRVFHVRQTQTGDPFNAPFTCTDLATGATLWSFDLTFFPGEGVTWCLGVKNGAVYATRSSTLCKFEVATGVLQWAAPGFLGLYSGSDAVFTPSGDIVMGAYSNICRVNQADGNLVWAQNRNLSQIGSEICAIGNGGVYTLERIGLPAGDVRILKFDVDTGTPTGVSPTIPTFAAYNSPFVGPDGTVYQHVETGVGGNVFRLHAFTDTGAGLTAKWNVQAGNCRSSRFTFGPDGSVYHFGVGNSIQRLNPVNGAVLNSTTITVDAANPIIRMACDSSGRVFVTNGSNAQGRVYAFSPTLAPSWSVGVPNIGYSGPALAQDGSLVVTGSNPDIIAFRAPPATPYCFGDGSGSACPCGNNGSASNGCASSVNANGARLESSGVPFVSADSVILLGSGMPNGTALYFQGTLRAGGGPGVPFGDGLRCAGGTIVRLATKQNAAGASQFPSAGDLPVSVRGLVPATGGTRDYQAWYRNAAAYCTTATFNLSNGLELTWFP